jgi:sulfur-carrier protein
MTSTASKQVRVQYYAMLREERGISDENIDTSANTAGELYAELQRAHGFTLDAGQLKVVVNAEFAEWDRPLSAGDTVVFIPPVAGG